MAYSKYGILWRDPTIGLFLKAFREGFVVLAEINSKNGAVNDRTDRTRI